jgi:hypothetical protein
MSLGRKIDAYKKLDSERTIPTRSAPATLIQVKRGMKAIKATDSNNNKTSGEIFNDLRS